MSVSEIEFDPETGEILAPALVLEQLLAAARAGAPLPEGALTASGAVEAGAAHPRLGLALRIATRPLVELRLERGEQSAAGWVAPGGSALLVPVDDGRRRLLTLETSHLALALVRLNALGPRPVDESRPVIALTPADLARALAVRDPGLLPEAQAAEREALGELLEGLRARWRVETHWTPPDNSPGTRSVEVLDNDAGALARRPRRPHGRPMADDADDRFPAALRPASDRSGARPMSAGEARTLRPGRMRAGFDSMLEYANEGRRRFGYRRQDRRSVRLSGPMTGVAAPVLAATDMRLPSPVARS